MGLPGFAAASSLYRGSGHYYAAAIWGSSFVSAEHAASTAADPHARYQFLSEGHLQLSSGCDSNPCRGSSGPVCCHDSKGNFNGCCGTSCCYGEDGGAGACPHAGQFCCGAQACTTGEELCCGGGCVSQDESNCGSCGTSCGGNQTCCNGSCINTATDKSNCGGCNSACNANELCCNGSCIGQSASNCRSCGNVCGPGQECAKNCYCLVGTTCGKECCTAGQQCCDGRCYDPAVQQCCQGITPHLCAVGDACMFFGCCNSQDEKSCILNCAPLDSVCCPGSPPGWCPKGWHCCDDACCPDGQECCANGCCQGGLECCQSELGSIHTCCPPGTCDPIHGICKVRLGGLHPSV